MKYVLIYESAEGVREKAPPYVPAHGARIREFHALGRYIWRACRMVETLIAELAGVCVRERCERGVKPRCCFEVMLAESAAARE